MTASNFVQAPKKPFAVCLSIDIDGGNCAGVYEGPSIFFFLQLRGYVRSQELARQEAPTHQWDFHTDVSTV